MDTSNGIELFSEKYKVKRTILKEVIPLQKPFCLSIEPSNICNFKCIMCPQGDDKYSSLAAPLQNMNEDCFKKIIKDLKDWGNTKFKVIKLYSIGEPLLNTNICEMLKEIKNADLADMVEITTNASLLTLGMSKKFVEYGLDYLRVSIYSVIEEKNRNITRSNIKPDTIKTNIIKLKEIRSEAKSKKPFIQAKIIDAYSEEENKIFEEYYKGIADEVFIDKPMNSNNIGDVLEKLYKEKGKEVNKDIHNLYFYKKSKACRYPFDHLTIKSNGDVAVCCADWLRTTKIGNIMENTLEEIWNGKKLYEFRKMQLENKRYMNKSCRECELPLRDYPEDDIDGFPIEKLSYIEK